MKSTFPSRGVTKYSNPSWSSHWKHHITVSASLSRVPRTASVWHSHSENHFFRSEGSGGIQVGGWGGSRETEKPGIRTCPQLSSGVRPPFLLLKSSGNTCPCCWRVRYLPITSGAGIVKCKSPCSKVVLKKLKSEYSLHWIGISLSKCVNCNVDQTRWSNFSPRRRFACPTIIILFEIQQQYN